VGVAWLGILNTVKFSELVRLLEGNGFTVAKEKGSIRYYAKASTGWSVSTTTVRRKFPAERVMRF
jgi:predicted RNA binding protein YcfA (HicA-like mRNA interferase family)